MIKTNLRSPRHIVSILLPKMSNLQTRSQTTTVWDNKKDWQDQNVTPGPMEDVPVHPMGDDVFHDENISYHIKTDDGTEYQWNLGWYSVTNAFTKRMEGESFHMVQRTKDGITTEWDSPPTIESVVLYQCKGGSYHRFYPDGSVDARYGDREYKYSAKKNAIPIQGVQSVKNLLDDY